MKRRSAVHFMSARSILGDPRSPTMQKVLNLKVKYRESFRPFAPSVLREKVADWFDLDTDSPYMLLVADVKDSRCRKMSAEEQQLFGIDKLNVLRSEIPAVTHVDYSARIQTVHKETNPRYHALIEAFAIVERQGTPRGSFAVAPIRRPHRAAPSPETSQEGHPNA